MHRKRRRYSLTFKGGESSSKLLKDAYDIKDAVKQSFFNGSIVVRNQIASGIYLGGRLVWVDVVDAGYSDIYRLRRKL